MSLKDLPIPPVPEETTLAAGSERTGTTACAASSHHVFGQVAGWDEQWRNQGYPVGCGSIQRASALVINRRMKRRGMSWLRKNATAVVSLRVDLLNLDAQHCATARLFP